MENNQWKITQIDTGNWAKKFADLLLNNGNKTYFLQGKWGSGKSEYLETVEEKVEELGKNKKKRLKFIYLKLWKPKNNESLPRQLFSTIHPIWDKIGTYIGWFFVILMICSSVILAIRSIFQMNPKNNIVFATITIAVIITTLFNLSKNNLINIDKFLLWWCLKTLRNQAIPKVLIIDDFDRINIDIQKELYKIFNAIQERGSAARIIFVGDWENIDKVKNNFLDKIIDQIISLPIVLKPQSFGPKIEQIISNNLDINYIDETISDLFINEHRTLREANHFLTYVKNEFCGQDKIGRVQIDQQLLIIYLYLFHKDIYKLLVDNWDKIKWNESIDITDNTLRISKDNKEIMLAVRSVLNRKKDSNFPKVFIENPTNYFINDFSNSHSYKELGELINNPKKITDLAYSKNLNKIDYSDELLLFIHSLDDEGDFKKTLFAALFAMSTEPRHTPNDLVTLILRQTEKKIEIFENKTNLDYTSFETKVIYKMSSIVKKVIEKLGFKASLTELIYIYRSCLLLYPIGSYIPANSKPLSTINIYSLTQCFAKKAKIIENKVGFGKTVYDAEALLVELCFSKTFGNIEIKNDPKFHLASIRSKSQKIEQLADFEYVAFWEAYLDSASNASEEKILNFEYSGQKYGDYVHNRYKSIQQACANCFMSEKNSKLNRFLKSGQWSNFVLKLAASIGLNNLCSSQAKQIIINKINQLLNSYHEKVVKMPIKSGKREINDDELLKILQVLLDKVERDPYWTRKLDG